jgi:hypothetical protein
MGECGLACAGHVFDKQVSARKQRDEREAHGFGLALDNSAHHRFEFANAREVGGGSFRFGCSV